KEDLFMKALQTILLAASILFLNLSSMAQTNKYNTEWKKVENLLTKENKPQSALAEVRNIYALAKKEGQDAHVIKALVYMTGLQESTREDNQALSIQEIESEITSAKEPARSI